MCACISVHANLANLRGMLSYLGDHEPAEILSAVMLGQNSSTNLQPSKDIGMRNYKFQLTLVVVIICVLITGIWILLSLPILVIIYHHQR